MTVQISYRVGQAISQRWKHALSNQRWKRLSASVAQGTPLDTTQAPVIFFNASTRLQAMSQNAAYSFLASQALRGQGVPVIQFACQVGMSRCVLGSDRDDVTRRPPCERCAAQSKSVFSNMPVRWFDFQVDSELSKTLEEKNLTGLCELVYQGAPLGFWAVNSLRWVLRRHHLIEDAATMQFMKYYILSGWNIVQQFSKLAQKVNPQAVVIFNGMFFPEAAVRYVCLQRGIKIVTHEVGIRPFTAFFTTGEATAYPIHIDSSFQLTSEMDQRLDAYLSDRFQGNFSMAGIRFWPEIKGLDQSFLKKAGEFKQIVPIFTNVIFDTSQVHANTIFADMFVWLENIRQVIIDHPETLFVIRAHPDEFRAGKESRESVRDWVKAHGVDQLANVVFVDSQEFISSYDLIQRARFVIVYNSTIGLEAALMGKAVLAGGKARFTQLATAYLPDTIKAYEQKLNELLSVDTIKVPEEFLLNARRFLYYQLFISSLPFDVFLQEDGVWKGYVTLKEFPLSAFTPEVSPTIQSLVAGIILGKPFELSV